MACWRIVRALVDSAELKRAIDRVMFASPNDWSHLCNRVRLSVRDAVLHIDVFSGDAWSRVSLEVVEATPGQVIVPSKPFQQFVRNCADGCEVAIRGELGAVLIDSATARMRLETFPLETWTPEISPSNDRANDVPLIVLDGVRRILYAAHPSDPLLQCVRWGDGHVAVSDHYRLAMCTENLGLETFLLPATLWRHVLRNVRDSLKITLDENVVRFDTEGAIYVALRALVRYPDRARLIRATSRHHLIFDKIAFKQTLGGTSFMDPDGKICVDYHGDSTASLHSTRGGFGNVRGRIAATGSFDGTLILDVTSLNDVLAQIQGSEIRFHIEDAHSPVVVVEGNVTHVMVPYEA
jgi:DNA polymerase III sliding clamp (beta) subunit (PCNA family)